MRVWGYTSGSFCVVLGLLSLVLAILLLVMAKSDVTQEFKNDSVGLAAVVVVVAVVAMIMGGVTLWKIYLANQLYLRVSSEAATGKISVGRSVPAQVPLPPEPPPPPPVIASPPTMHRAAVPSLPPPPAPPLTTVDDHTDDDFI